MRAYGACPNELEQRHIANGKANPDVPCLGAVEHPVVIFGFVSGAIGAEWIIFIALGGALIHALAVASRK